MSKPSASRRQVVDTLRLSDRNSRSLISSLDDRSASFAGSNRRRDARLPYRSGGLLPIELIHPGGSTATYVVRPRNLSTTGLGFLHGNYVHPGTRVRVPLIDHTKSATWLRGEVARCIHVQDKVHEVGVRFEHPIELENYVEVEVRESSLGDDEAGSKDKAA